MDYQRRCEFEDNTVNGKSVLEVNTNDSLMRNQSGRIQKIHMSPIRKVAGMLDEAREQRNMISLGGGAPSIPPPQAFLDEFARLLKSNPLRSCGYTGTRGIPELREAIAEDATKYGHVDFDPVSEIIISSGATEAIFSLAMSLVDSGDDVVLTDPTYLGYKEMIELAQGKPRWLPVSVEDG